MARRIFLFACSLMAAAFLASAPGLAQSCADEAAMRSDRPGPESEITFLNPSNEARRIFWIDQNGQRAFYGVVEPGNAYVQVSATGHSWVVTDEADACLLIVTATPEPLAVDVALEPQPPVQAVAPPPPGQQRRIGGGQGGSTVRLESTAGPQAPVATPSPIELYQLTGYFRLVPRNDDGKAINNLASGRPEIVRVRPDWDSGQWRFEEVPGTEFVRIRNRWKAAYLKDDRGRPLVEAATPDDEEAHWEFEPVDGLPFMQLVNRASGRTLVSLKGNAELAEDVKPAAAGHWQLQPVGESKSPIAVMAPSTPRPRNVERDTAYEEALDHCRDLGGYWTGASCRFPRVARAPDCGRGWAWAEDIGECVWDRPDYREVCPPWMSGRPPFCEREMSCRGGTLRISSRGHSSCDCPFGTAIWGDYPNFSCVRSYASYASPAAIAIPVIGAVAGIVAYDQWRRADRRRRDANAAVLANQAATNSFNRNLETLDLNRTFGQSTELDLTGNDPARKARIKELLKDPTLSPEARSALIKMDQGGKIKLTPAENAARFSLIATDPVLSPRSDLAKLTPEQRAMAEKQQQQAIAQNIGAGLDRTPAQQAADLQAVADGSYAAKARSGNFTPTTPAEKEAALVHKRALAKLDMGRNDFTPAERKLLNDIARTQPVKTGAGATATSLPADGARIGIDYKAIPSTTTGPATGAGGQGTATGGGLAAPKNLGVTTGGGTATGTTAAKPNCKSGDKAATCTCVAPMAVLADGTCAVRAAATTTATPTTTTAPATTPCSAWQTGTPGKCVDIAYTCEGGTKVGGGKCSCPAGTRPVPAGGLSVKCERMTATTGTGTPSTGTGGATGARIVCAGGRATATGCDCPAGTRVEGATPNFRCVAAATTTIQPLTGTRTTAPAPVACREGQSTTTGCTCVAPMTVTVGTTCGTRTLATPTLPTTCAAGYTGTPPNCVAVDAKKAAADAAKQAADQAAMKRLADDNAAKAKAAADAAAAAAKAKADADARTKGAADAAAAAAAKAKADADARNKAAADAAAAAKAKADADARARSAADAAKAKADADARTKAAADAAKAKADADARNKAAADAARAKAEADARARAAAEKAAADARAKAAADAAKQRAAADAARQKAEAEARARAAADQARQKAAADAARAKAEADARAKAAAQKAAQPPQCPQGQKWINNACRPG